ncbi:MAG: exodeoxyribonuclease VII small subunit [Verrucomicrobiaceae bacterium]|nr:exodeoxyribonuclease VII small subunit [Verrucomicrobiaceae bacterium]
MSDARHKEDEPSFEQAMERLDEIVASMEGERMSLEDMVRSYEDGVRLLRVCRGRIDSAKRRVEMITTDLDGGKAVLTPFESTAAAETPAAAAAADEGESKSKARRSKTDPKPDDIRLF